MSDRLSELKAKGYRNLEGAEREEYRKLVAVAEGDIDASKSASEIIEQTKPVVTTKLVKSSGMITVTKEELSKMVAEEVAKLRSKEALPMRPIAPGGFEEYKPPEKAKPVATIRKWRENSDSEWGLMTKAEHHKWVWEEDEGVKTKKDIFRFTFLLPDGTEKTVDMPYVSLIDMNDSEVVRILDMPKKKFVQKQGWTRTKFLDKEGAHVEKDGHVGNRKEIEIMMDLYPDGALVELENGRQIKVPVNCLNA